jgi:hypothetical protein
MARDSRLYNLASDLAGVLGTTQAGAADALRRSMGRHCPEIDLESVSPALAEKATPAAVAEKATPAAVAEKVAPAVAQTVVAADDTKPAAK